jgi:ABC-type phosphate/phosphonate transport system substrate-binding protein
MAIAALTMYSQPVAVQNAYNELVEELAKRLGSHLDPAPHDLLALWNHPELLLAQTCGYPWVTQLKGQVKLVAAPRYRLPGCEGATHCSVILVPNSSKAITLADLRDKRVALNGHDSNSGMNLLRQAIAPHSEDGRFFGEVIESGSHINSMVMLQQDRADVAAIDSVTFGYLQRDLPAQTAGLRVLQRTHQSPALPFITAKTRSDEDIQRIRESLSQLLLEREDLRKVLAIDGLDLVNDATYSPLLKWEQEAIDLRYPTIA